MEIATIFVPTTALPALIGPKGNRIKDINATSGATVRFDTTHAEVITTAYIEGSTLQIRTAVSLLKVAVLHAQAAHSKPPPPPYLVTEQSQADYDLHMFAHETHSASFPSWSK